MNNQPRVRGLSCGVTPWYPNVRSDVAIQAIATGVCGVTPLAAPQRRASSVEPDENPSSLTLNLIH
jgi:hypothetical protein